MNSSFFFISESDTVSYAMEQIDKNSLKVVFILRDNKLVGAVSDGDIRRFIINGGNISERVMSVVNYDPIYIHENQISNAKQIIEERKITALPVINFNKEVIDIYTLERTFKVKADLLEVPVVIMAGGKGTRLYPYTKILPKPLIPIGEIPITELIIKHFKKYGCNNFYMIVNHRKNMIKSYFDGEKKEYNLSFVDEERPLGTGGGLSLLKQYQLDEVIFTNCDIIIDANYRKIYDYHKAENNFITIVCARKKNRIPYGVVLLDEKNNYLGMKEKPSFETIINTGMYIIPRLVIDQLKDNEVINFPDIVERYRLKGEKIGIYIIEEEAFMDMGQLEELEKMKNRIESKE